MKKRIVSIVLCLALAISGILPNGLTVKAEEKSFVVKPTIVGNVHTAPTKLIATCPAVNDTSYKYVFKFTLKDPSEVRINGLSRYTFWSFDGNTKYSLTNSADEFSTTFSKTWDCTVNADHPWADQADNFCDQFFLLNKGTYYLTVSTLLPEDFATKEYNEHKIYDYDLGYWMSLNASVYVKPIKLKSCKAKKGQKMTVSYSKTTADGYQVQYGTNSKFKKAKTATSTKGSVTVKSLKKKKTYYVRVRAFRKDSDGKRLYANWSNVKKVKIKK